MPENQTVRSKPADLAALRQAIRDHALWPEEGCVTRILRGLELTGGGRPPAGGARHAMGVRGPARPAPGAR